MIAIVNIASQVTGQQRTGFRSLLRITCHKRGNRFFLKFIELLSSFIPYWHSSAITCQMDTLPGWNEGGGGVWPCPVPPVPWQAPGAVSCVLWQGWCVTAETGPSLVWDPGLWWKIGFFSPKRFIFFHACATWSKLPFRISAMRMIFLHVYFKFCRSDLLRLFANRFGLVSSSLY